MASEVICGGVPRVGSHGFGAILVLLMLQFSRGEDVAATPAPYFYPPTHHQVHPPLPMVKHDFEMDDALKKTLQDGSMPVDIGFAHAFFGSLSMIIVSELGDKTFFIAAVMAMRFSRTVVFSGAISALAVMHCLSAFLGYATTVIPRWFTYYVSSGLFAVFGIKMLREGYTMAPDEGQEE